MSKLNRDFYNRDTLTVASALLGKYLVRMTERGPLVCRISETEAYIGRMDKASHAWGYRKTARNQVMFGPPGFAYIYLIYGLHSCLNFVTEQEGEPSAVLLRGGLPRGNLETLAQNRFGLSVHQLSAYQMAHFLDGPGKLCRALSLSREENATDLTGGTLFVCDRLEDVGLPSHLGDDAPFAVHIGKRIGIDYAEEAADFPWRFFL
ncbi:MAG: DNA-3-methyladenine glycosylase [Oscillospiraceae bacterium]|nr:DNA-3-methyladenine glycosylase [Oscillospiraceae bacterium]